MSGMGILRWLDDRLVASAAHARAHEAGRASASRVGARLVLVHRTARPGSARPWTDLFTGGTLPPGPTPTAWERAQGHEEAVYLFLGAGAYPHGKLALLFRTLPGPATFAPIDTGGLYAGRMIGPDGARIAPGEAEALFAQLYTEDALRQAFAERWIAAHFDDPRDYVRRPMRSAPDLPPLHGARSDTGHRLAWTIEVQHHGPIPLEAHLAGVVCARRADARALPAVWRRVARTGRDNELDDEGFFALISDTILSFVEDS